MLTRIWTETNDILHDFELIHLIGILNQLKYNINSLL